MYSVAPEIIHLSAPPPLPLRPFPAAWQPAGGRPATEYLWMNYDAPDRLHDYRYLGDDFRERERIKRKKQRWVARLERMDGLERKAILWAIQEAGLL